MTSEGVRCLKPVTRVDLVLYNEDGDSWIREFATHEELMQVYLNLPEAPLMTNWERFVASLDRAR